LSTPPPPGAGDPDEPDLAAAVALRQAGYAEAEAVRRQELRDLSDKDAAIIADDLLQLLPFLADEPDRGSGLVEQQRWFSRIRQRGAQER
jgi:hypothetical protein